MKLHQLKTHFPNRMSEWANGAILTTFGVYLILHPRLFDDPSSGDVFHAMRAMVDFLPYEAEAIWGLLGCFVGLARLVALYINGAHVRTPAIRMVTAGFSAFVWTQVIIGLFAVSNLGLAVYPWLLVIDLVAAYRAGTDSVFAESKRKEDRLGDALRVGSSKRGAIA